MNALYDGRGEPIDVPDERGFDARVAAQPMCIIVFDAFTRQSWIGGDVEYALFVEEGERAPVLDPAWCVRLASCLDMNGVIAVHADSSEVAHIAREQIIMATSAARPQ